MKKNFLLIGYPIIVAAIVLGVIFFTGLNNKSGNESLKNMNKIDFTYATGAMISKEGMTEDEMKMHDAKVIQYELYQIKDIIADGFSYENVQLIGVIASKTYDSMFSNEKPSKWLYTKYIAFEGFKTKADGFESTGGLGDYFQRETAKSMWSQLEREYDNIVKATDDYVGATLAERAKQDENLKNNLVPILDKFNEKNIKIVYRNEDEQNEYLMGKHPEPSNETVLFAILSIKKILDEVPMGETSTLTLAHSNINKMVEYLSYVTIDFESTRKEPNKDNANTWIYEHYRLYKNWNHFMGLINDTKQLFAE